MAKRNEMARGVTAEAVEIESVREGATPSSGGTPLAGEARWQASVEPPRPSHAIAGISSVTEAKGL
jgi:hypothetical protein